ncbi:hypothetical protein WK13_16870 [Burkholderia ubonensis]|uniref:beta-ketoacyl synthase N-terminal-like domain-containing protein n=1 Tax=Burkholderia ubonensis TaxID=101571 RepID=UPI000758E599|nr:beta-ketoacyl synthase N-terminal-like domain-containing protein [Burkholderia ubonensis]KVR36001.1 hypothetical protein WK13_16870 [Burkholderia ubonensis]
MNPVVVGAACCFPSGPRIELADAAVRSALNQFRHHPSYRDRCGFPVQVSRFPHDDPFALQRGQDLLRAVIHELATQLESRRLLAPAAHAWLVLPAQSSRPGIPDDPVEPLIDVVRRGWPNNGIEGVAIVRGGHASGMVALQQARAYLEAEPGRLALVFGVESMLSGEALMWLECQRLLHGTHSPSHGSARTNPHGRVPGEGAAAVALTHRLPDGGKSAWASLPGVGVADEHRTYASGEPCTGVGLTRAAHAALSQCGRDMAGQVGTVVLDLNDEPYRADQFGFTALRLARYLAPGWRRVVPPLASGDLNAASAIAHVALAAHALRQRRSHAHYLVLSSSDDALRGAAVLGAIDPHPALPEIRAWQSPSTSMA